MNNLPRHLVSPVVIYLALTSAKYAICSRMINQNPSIIVINETSVEKEHAKVRFIAINEIFVLRNLPTLITVYPISHIPIVPYA